MILELFVFFECSKFSTRSSCVTDEHIRHKFPHEQQEIEQTRLGFLDVARQEGHDSTTADQLLDQHHAHSPRSLLDNCWRYMLEPARISSSSIWPSLGLTYIRFLPYSEGSNPLHPAATYRK